MSSASSVQTEQWMHPFTVTASTVSSILSDTNISVDQKMAAISHAFQANAQMFDFFNQQNIENRDLCSSLAAKNGILKDELEHLKQNSQHIAVHVNAFTAWKEGRIDEKKQEVEDSAKDYKSKVSIKRCLNRYTSISLNTLSIGLLFNPKIFIGAILAINLPARMIENHLRSEALLVKHFPEAINSHELREKTKKAIESIIKEEDSHNSNLRRNPYVRYDEDGERYERRRDWDDDFDYDWWNANETSRHIRAMQNILDEIAALRKEIIQDFY